MTVFSKLLSLALLASSSGAWEQTIEDAHPYEFPSLSAAGAHKFPMADCGSFKLHEASIDEIRAAYAAGTTTIVQVASCYVQRILQTNDYIKYVSRNIESIMNTRKSTCADNGPSSSSVVEVNPDYLTIAAALDAERLANKTRGRLHGIPFVVKENMGTSDKMVQT